MKSPILLDDLPVPRQDGLVELARHLRTALNAHKIYPVGHKMITQSIGRLLRQIRKLSKGHPYFVLSLFDDNLEFNGEQIKRRCEEAKYAKQIAGLFKDQRIQTLILRDDITVKEVSNLFALLMSHDFVEEGVLDFRSIEQRNINLSINSTVVRRTVGDNVRDVDRIMSSSELPDASESVVKNELPSHDPDHILDHLDPYVRTGQFFYDLMNEFPSRDDWPTIQSVQHPSSDSLGWTPLQSSGEFSSFSLPHLPEVRDASLDVLSGISSGSYAHLEGDVGGELMLELEEDTELFTTAPVSLPGLPSMHELEQWTPALQEQMLQNMTVKLDAIMPEMLNRYMQQLSSHQPNEAYVRESLLEHMTPERIESSQKKLIEQIEHSSVREEFAGAVTLFEDMLDKQLEKGILEGVSRALQTLERRAEYSSSEGMQAGVSRIVEHLQREEKVDALLEQGVDLKRKDARELLSQLAPKSLPQCIQALSASQTPEEKQKYAELLVELSRHASDEKREAGFAALIEQLDDLDSKNEQDFLFNVMRQYNPTQFEQYIFEHLQSLNNDAQQRMLLLDQAIAHDSETTRAFLKDLLIRRFFVMEPELEELLVVYLDRCGAMDGVQFVREQLETQHQDPSFRHSAIWLLGALQKDESLKLLRTILMQKNEDASYVFEESLRFQAVYTLTRSPLTSIQPILSEVSSDPSMLVQGQLALLSERPLTLETLRSAERDQSYAEVVKEQSKDTELESEENASLETVVAPPEIWMPPAFWTKPRIITMAIVSVVLLIALGWVLGRIFT